MTRADVAALFGLPRLLRRDPPAELWQYARRSCVLHLFLYRSPADGRYRVRHYETAARGATDIGETACLAGFLGAPGAERVDR